MAGKRKAIGKKTRFEVFKRDSFKCQYCGAAAPDVILEVDHIDPVSKDGANDMVNYITSCRACNSGKSDRTLDDNTALAKQRAQLEELNERREQLEMMLNWRNAIKDINEEQFEAAHDAWCEVTPGWNLNDKGQTELRKYIKKYGMSAVLDAFDTVKLSYIVLNDEGKATQESVFLGWSKVGGVLRMASLPDSERDLHYIKGILRNRCSYVPYDVFKTLKYAVAAGVSIEDMRLEAKHAANWTRFNGWLVAAVEDAGG